MKINKYINPGEIIRSLTYQIKDISYYLKYAKVLKSLEEEGKIEKIGLTLKDKKMYVGINLNPELLIYSDDTQENIEIKYVSDRMRKYTDFCQKEGILDFIVAEYDRVQTKDYYGYVVEIRYKFKHFSLKSIAYDIAYLTTALISTVLGILYIV